jgi:gamma-glutamylcyclotransferase (GGCT)/AIG2-like uncharacterized protein YtfP
MHRDESLCQVDKVRDAGPGRCWLFVYGHLKPGYRPPRTMTEAWPDRVRGLLYELPEYPVGLALGKGDSWIRGFTLNIAEEELAELDRYEGLDQDVYRRVLVETELGFTAWAYEYARRLPAEARGPLEVWRPDEWPPMGHK